MSFADALVVLAVLSGGCATMALILWAGWRSTRIPSQVSPDEAPESPDDSCSFGQSLRG